MPLGANKAAIMGVAGVSTGDVVLLSSQTASGDSSIVFTSGITSTYGEYIFKLYNINPASSQLFQVNFSIDGGSNYNVAKTTSFFRAYHYENDSGTGLGYMTGNDLAQGTGGQPLNDHSGDGSDENTAAELHLFNPASTTYVKHFYSRSNNYHASDISVDAFVGGYANTTSAVNAIQFAPASGDFDGKIKMWGVK